MKIVDFIETFKGTEYKDKLIQKHITKPYMHWLMKVAEAENIVQKSCYDKDGNFKLNSPLRYYLYIVTIIKNYTDLEFSDDVMSDFNLLEESGVNDMMIVLIDDVKRFDTVLKMTFDDHFENYRSLPSWLDSKKNGIIELIDQFLNTMESEADVNGEGELYN